MTDLIPVNDPSDIPENMTEAQEADFWSTHEAGPDLTAQLQRDPDTLAALMDVDTLRNRARAARGERPPKSTPTSLRLGVDLERRLRHLAELKGTSYQTLLKEFVLERVYEEEKRLKLL